MSSQHVIITLDPEINDKLSTNYIMLHQFMTKTRTESLQKWNSLLSLNGQTMKKRKFVLEVFNSIKMTQEQQKQFLLEYLVRDYKFPIGNWMQDEEFMVEAIKKKKEMLYFNTNLWERKSFVCQVAKYWKGAIIKARCTIDSDIISTALEHKPKSLQYCKIDIRNDKEMVMKSLGKTYGNIIFIGETLLDDIDILRKCLSKSETLKNLKYSMSAKELMLEIVKRYPLSLLRFYKFLKDEIDFQVTKHDSIMINGKLHNYRDDMLDSVEDVQVATKIILFYARKYNCFSRIVREDVETFKLAMSIDCNSISNIPDSFGQNRQVLIWLLENRCSNIHTDGIIGRIYPNDDEYTNHLLRKYVIDVIERRGYITIPFCLQSHENLCFKSMKEFPGLQNLFNPHVVKKLLDDEELMFECVMKSSKMMKYLNKVSNDFLIKCLKANPQIFSELTNNQVYNLLSSSDHVRFLFEIDPKLLELALVRENLNLSEQMIENALNVKRLGTFQKIGNWMNEMLSRFNGNNK